MYGFIHPQEMTGYSPIVGVDMEYIKKPEGYSPTPQVRTVLPEKEGDK